MGQVGSGREESTWVDGPQRSSDAHLPGGDAVTANLDDLARKTVMYALRHARGRYDNARTSQLSGIPSSTLYEWRRSDIYVPDFHGERPTAWSYRDLVYLRLLAWLRQGGMERNTASEQVRTVKAELISGREIQYLFADRDTLVADEERTSRVTGENLLPFDDLLGLFRTFDLLAPVAELGGQELRRLWAPDLVTPSSFTFISPWVMAGDPCVARTRIPTASIHALREERGLESAEIVDLYPGLTIEAADDAYVLERRLRGLELPASAAA
jgi:uncharacterized protein (DUF433 family)